MFASKPKACEGCPAYDWGVGFVPPTGPRNPPEIAVVGQGPGDTEAQESIPFHPDAPSGWRITRWLNQAGLNRSDLAIGNIVQCWLPARKTKGHPTGNREPTQGEVEFCYRKHVGPWLRGMEHLKWVIPVGVPARKFLMKESVKDPGQEKWVGTRIKGTLPPVNLLSGN
jgi:uracil-DNA glycosylase family 4